jgi:hypothetical protein
MDGTERGPLPIRLPALGVGKHTWHVEAPRFEPADGSLDFVAGKNYLVEVPMRSSRGVFVVESTPAGATVTLDGKVVGVTPLRLEDVEPGKHAVMLSQTGLASVLRAVDNTDGSRGEVKVTLPKAGGSLDIATGSPDAVVSIQGAPIGSGARVQAGPFEKGKVKMRVSVGQRDVVDFVTIPSRGTVQLHVVGTEILARKPLVQRWGFWAAVAGGAIAGGATTAAVVVANSPAPPPTGDTVVVLP